MKTILRLLIVVLLIAVAIWCLYIDKFFKELKAVSTPSVVEVQDGRHNN